MTNFAAEHAQALSYEQHFTEETWKSQIARARREAVYVTETVRNAESIMPNLKCKGRPHANAGA